MTCDDVKVSKILTQKFLNLYTKKFKIAMTINDSFGQVSKYASKFFIALYWLLMGVDSVKASIGLYKV